MVSLMTFYGLMWAAGGNDIIAIRLNLSINQITYFMRVRSSSDPLIAFMITRRWCISLQRADQEKLLHGLESGVIMRDPQGGYTEKSPPAAGRRGLHPDRPSAGRGLRPGVRRPTRTAWPPRPRARTELRARLSRLWYADNIQKPTRAELEEAHHHAEAEHAHEAALEGHAADGHQFDGRHEIDGEAAQPAALTGRLSRGPGSWTRALSSVSVTGMTT